MIVINAYGRLPLKEFILGSTDAGDPGAHTSISLLMSR
jgi:hypothetical protein